MGHRCPQLLPLYFPCLSAVVHIQIIVIASQLPYYGSLLTFALRVVKVVILNDLSLQPLLPGNILILQNRDQT